MSTGNPAYLNEIWQGMLYYIGNAFGVSALMGNWVAESGLTPYRVQGDFTNPFEYPYSKQYTDQVDSGAISEYDFVHNGPNGGGYSLAQWTYYTRKQGLYDLHRSSGQSIGSSYVAMNWCWQELNGGYKNVLAKLQSATENTLRDVSNYVLFYYESPADQGIGAQNIRYNNAVDVYNACSGLPPIQPTPSPVAGSHSKIWLYLRRR